MNVKAKARFIRMSPRKTRLLVGLIRGRSVAEARKQLQFSQKDAATPVLKLLNSAVANAEHNFKLDTSSMIVKEAFVDEGPVMYRYTPRAQGRATPIRKRMSHITIVIGDKEAEVVKNVEAVKEEKTAKKPVAKKAKASRKSKTE